MAMRELVTGGAACAVPGSSSSSANPLGALSNALVGSSSKTQVGTCAFCYFPPHLFDIIIFLHPSTHPCMPPLRYAFGEEKGNREERRRNSTMLLL